MKREITKRFRRVQPRPEGVSRVTWFRFGLTLYLGRWLISFGITDGKAAYATKEQQ